MAEQHSRVCDICGRREDFPTMEDYNRSPGWVTLLSELFCPSCMVEARAWIAAKRGEEVPA